jgi:hypothetical protein
MSEWTIVERPGYFGAKRDKIQQGYDEKYGSGNWALRWQVGDALFTREQMNMLYEDAYYEYLRAHPDILKDLIQTASDVYDDAPSNVECGFSYDQQETDRTHVQDVAIRRVVSRLGQTFQGDELLQIRDNLGSHPLSMTLSPGQVPFHMPQLLLPELEGWWKPKSVESFYQSNKVLCIIE